MPTPTHFNARPGRLYTTKYYEVYTHERDNQVILKIFDCATDATPSRHPVTGKPASSNDSDEEEEEEGRVKYWLEADETAVRRWKRTLGEMAIKHTAQPAIQSSGRTWFPRDGRGSLQDLPQGYSLFVLLTGDKHAPRRDYYLKGSRYVNRFRTPQEFLPHLIWLMKGQPMESGSPGCECRYCDRKTTQTQISQKFGFTSSHTRSSRSERTRRTLHGEGTIGRSTVQPLTIPAKDYTKLNLGISPSRNTA